MGKLSRRRRSHAYRGLGLRHRVWLTTGAVALSAAGVVTYAVADQVGPADGKDRAPRKPSIQTMRLQSEGAGRKGLDRKSTARFSAVLVTWDDPDAKAKGTPQVRTRDRESGDWSGWQKLPAEPNQADGAEGERAAGRGGTESLWAGDSDGIEVRLVGADGKEAPGQPAGMDVKLLDPGTDPAGSGTAMAPAAFAADAPSSTPAATDPAPTHPAPTDPAPTDQSSSQASPGTPALADPAATTSASPTATPSATPTPTPTPTVPAPRPSTVVKPPIITQAQWGASTDYDGTPGYGTTIKAAVIHHTGTDGDNTLSCSESRARLRSIQQEHFARGYYDIGYNFLVDRCGQIFEGRSGGMDLPVVGAHDIGFNTDTVGISYLGNFETAKPSRAALDAIARVVAWKFGMYGIDPTGKVTMVSGSPKGQDGNLVDKGQSITLPRVFGHRDTNATACPGKNLYPKLSRIATLAKTPGISHALPTSDLTRDGISDLVLGLPKANGLRVVPGSKTGPLTSARKTITQDSAGVPGATETGDEFGAATAWGDVNGDGYADLAVGAPGEDSEGTDRGAVTVLFGPALTSGAWYTTTGVQAAGARLGSSVALGDFNGDGKADLFAAGTGQGGNYQVRLTDGATSYGTLTTATGAVAYLDSATGDFNRDGYTDVAVNYRDTGGVGRVVRFAGSKTGLTKAGVLSVKGGRSVASGDVNDDGLDDLVIGQPVAKESGGKSGGQITMLLGSSAGFTTTGMRVIDQDTSGVPGGNESGDDFGTSVSVGDYNGDGYADVLAGTPGEDVSSGGVNRVDAGSVLLVKGGSTGLTGTGSVSISQDTSGVPGSVEKGDRTGASVSLTDLSGYGRADLTFAAEGEDAWDGMVLHIPSNSTGLGYSHTLAWTKNTLGTPTGGRLGQTLTP
ncbi:FG-GAP-like repeat-containing protein [Streptomyces sp. NPDC048182]|uniref:FG-GAP-like repeat-containing protein n=1 Tax=Streptomyces sp. NPDC048182 TaxID=3365507 RepID=UPI00371671A9